MLTLVSAVITTRRISPIVKIPMIARAMIIWRVEDPDMI